MILLQKDKFLRDGTAGKDLTPRAVEIDANRFTGIAIHPSSEVDLVLVDDHWILSPRSIVPLDLAKTHSLTPIRLPLTEDILTGSGNLLGPVLDSPNASGHALVGERLVVQLYEKCDPLVPPTAGRTPRYKDALLAAASIPTTAATARLVLRVPMQGRRGCCIGMARVSDPVSNVDLSMIIAATKAGRRSYGLAVEQNGWVTPYNFANLTSIPVSTTTETWFGGSGTAPTLAYDATKPAFRTFTIGGFGDNAESVDELRLYLYGAAGGDAVVFAESFGDIA